MPSPRRSIICELVGFGTNSDGGHVTQPTAETMQIAMQLALADAHLSPDAIGYINAHGTATDRGDIAESLATYALFGNTTPISSLKGNLGHTLGACGAIESWAAIHMMQDNWFAPPSTSPHRIPYVARWITSSINRAARRWIM